MDLDALQLRRQLVIALAADDELYSLLTLKGGNALALVHGVGHRTSLDLDYSLERDVPRERLEPRVFAALRHRLSELGLAMFDEQFVARPASPTEPRWGGYRIEFKVIDAGKAAALSVDNARRQALRVDVGGQASVKWCIEISRQESIPEAEELPIGEGFTCRVYSRELIAVEKLRALCQQMNEYSHRQHPTPRPRDYFDLYALVTQGGVDLAGERVVRLLPLVFAAKDVPIALLQRIPGYSDFHSEDWDRVRNSIPAGQPREFRFFEQFVVGELERLYKVLGW